MDAFTHVWTSSDEGLTLKKFGHFQGVLDLDLVSYKELKLKAR